MSKRGKMILEGLKEAHDAVRGDLTVISRMRMHPTSGCHFCDFGVPVYAGWHIGLDDQRVACPLADKKSQHCPACGSSIWKYPDGRLSCLRCEWEEEKPHEG